MIENAKNVLSKTRNAYVTGKDFEDIFQEILDCILRKIRKEFLRQYHLVIMQ
mgnify:CR=1 FL=1